jgi:hypothetical protein
MKKNILKVSISIIALGSLSFALPTILTSCGKNVIEISGGTYSDKGLVGYPGSLAKPFAASETKNDDASFT